MGTPVEYIAFKGLDKGKPEEILLIEVKSGETKELSPCERVIRDLVESKKIRWLLIHLPAEMKKPLRVIRIVQGYASYPPYNSQDEKFIQPNEKINI
ncbi:MAG: hypothetical protein NZ872_01735 [Archaeoglobaceae archaeon]|nr:hypothetical protein [Archaeoglobaceae archaeon]